MTDMSQTSAPGRPVALVTGASRGIGAATARGFARRGHDVVVTYAARADAAADVVGDCVASGVRAVALPLDLGDLATVDRLFAEVDAQFGRLDVLVNNAGLLPPVGRVADLTAARVEHTLTVNAAGPALCAARAVERMSTVRG